MCVCAHGWKSTCVRVRVRVCLCAPARQRRTGVELQRLRKEDSVSLDLVLSWTLLAFKKQVRV